MRLCIEQAASMLRIGWLSLQPEGSAYELCLSQDPVHDFRPPARGSGSPGVSPGSQPR